MGVGGSGVGLGGTGVLVTVGGSGVGVAVGSGASVGGTGVSVGEVETAAGVDEPPQDANPAPSHMTKQIIQTVFRIISLQNLVANLLKINYLHEK